MFQRIFLIMCGIIIGLAMALACSTDGGGLISETYAAGATCAKWRVSTHSLSESHGIIVKSIDVPSGEEPFGATGAFLLTRSCAIR